VARIIGLVLYWAAILIAVAAGVGAIVVALGGDGDGNRFLIAGLLCTFGAIVWLIGFACRKALSGPNGLQSYPSD
jgi:hypothetical protein